MNQYKACPEYGARIDPGEHCDRKPQEIPIVRGRVHHMTPSQKALLRQRTIERFGAEAKLIDDIPFWEYIAFTTEVLNCAEFQALEGKPYE